MARTGRQMADGSGRKESTVKDRTDNIKHDVSWFMHIMELSIRSLRDDAVDSIKAKESIGKFNTKMKARLFELWAEAKDMADGVIMYANEIEYLSKTFAVDDKSDAHVRQKVFAKTGGSCVYCDAELGADWHVDHVVPVSKGGPTSSKIMFQAANLATSASGTMTL